MIAAPAAPFVDLDVTALQDFASEVAVDRFEPKGDEFHPACQSRARQGDPVPGAQDGFLPVERKVIAVFGHRDAGQKPGGGDAAFLRQCGQGRPPSQEGRLRLFPALALPRAATTSTPTARDGAFHSRIQTSGAK